MTLTTLHNYIRKKLRKDMVFVEFDRHPNFVWNNFLINIIPCLQGHGYQRPSRINYVCDEITVSLIKQ